MAAPDGQLTGRVEFIGRGGSLWSPRALQGGGFRPPVAARPCPTFDPMASLSVPVDVAPGSTATVRFVLGGATSRTQARMLIHKLLPTLSGVPEEHQFEVTPDASGAIELRVRRDETVNAVLSEVWLTDPAAPAPPAPPAGLVLETRSDDPVGHGVRAGERYEPDDAFYVDFSTPDPFAALERYGLAVRAAQGARPNPYTFPTVCSWYAGVWSTPGAQNHPEASRYGLATTAGQVDEMDAIRRMGFLSFGPVALRLVPDNYKENNQNGWWDDAHWQQEGFYAAPYETTKKWCDAIRARGGLPFTYIQPTFYASDNGISKDFRETHPDWMLGNDPARIIDYTDPGAQAYVRARFKALGEAGLAGLMVDYCDDLWVAHEQKAVDANWPGQLARGGYEDKAMSCAAHYRGWTRAPSTGCSAAARRSRSH